jgi:hypothetical protein
MLRDAAMQGANVSLAKFKLTIGEEAWQCQIRVTKNWMI